MQRMGHVLDVVHLELRDRASHVSTTGNETHLFSDKFFFMMQGSYGIVYRKPRKPLDMWSTDTKLLNSHTVASTIHWNGQPISARKAYELCGSSESFRDAFIDDLRALPFAAYFWETPPVTTENAQRAFEYVGTYAPTLAAASPDARAFDEHFGKDTSGEGVVIFENLGRDAMLVVPRPIVEYERYTHLGAFVRGAPRGQVHALLRALGEAVLARLSHRPLWVSTAGTGVYWLHVRLDSRPKYYRHTPYTNC